MTLTKKTLDLVLKQALEPYNQTLAEFHKHQRLDVRQQFWETACDLWVSIRWRDEEVDPKYRFDPDYDEFWNQAERHYPHYLKLS